MSSSLCSFLGVGCRAEADTPPPAVHAAAGNVQHLLSLSLADALAHLDYTLVLVAFTAALVAVGYGLGRRSLSALLFAAPRSVVVHVHEKPADTASKGGYGVTSVPLLKRQPVRNTRRVVIVANHLPVKVLRDAKSGQWSVEWRDEREYLANLQSLKRNMKVTWVGWVGTDDITDEEERDTVRELLAEHNCVPLFLPVEMRKKYYKFCKTCLWPIFHYVLPTTKHNFGREWRELWQSYNAINMLFAKAVSLACETKLDSVWVHNYHLLLLPSCLRKKMPRAKIGLFIHTPWPTSDVFRCLPSRENLLRGIMCADLVGFHTYDYARHFLSSCKRVLDLDFETMAGGALGIRYR
jgi:hypothetical protein